MGKFVYWRKGTIDLDSVATRLPELSYYLCDYPGIQHKGFLGQQAWLHTPLVSGMYMTCWLGQLRRNVWKKLASFSPFCEREVMRFPKRKLRFSRILSNTSGFTCHKDNVDWALRRNKLSIPFCPPRLINRLENF
jgi:hypothetical protein